MAREFVHLILGMAMNSDSRDEDNDSSYWSTSGDAWVGVVKLLDLIANFLNKGSGEEVVWDADQDEQHLPGYLDRMVKNGVIKSE